MLSRRALLATALVMGWPGSPCSAAGGLISGLAPSAWTPANIPSPAGWFKSDAGITLSGNEVTAWADQSSAANNLTANSSNEQAYFQGGFVNAFYRQVGGPFFHSLMRNTALSASLDQASISGGLIVWCSGSDSPLVSLGAGFSLWSGITGNFQFIHVYDGSVYVNTSLLHISRRMWVSWRNNGSALEVWTNNGHFNGTKLSSASLTSLYIASQAGSFGAPCQFKEIALSAVALSDTDQSNLNTYLAARALL